MASIVEQLKQGYCDVHHRGYDLKQVDFPDYIANIADCLFDEEQVVENLKKDGILLNMIHLGLSEFVVKFRAAVRPSDTSDKPKEIWAEEQEARMRGKEYVPALLPNPDERKSNKSASKIAAEVHRKMAIGLAQTGMDWSTAKTVLVNGGATELEELESIFTRAIEG